MDDKKTELLKHIKRYLGEDNWSLIRETTKAEHSLFQKIKLDINKSYFILGNRKTLEKFKAFYLTRCLKKRPLYTSCSLYEYAEGVTSTDKDEFGLNVFKELLFLYMHEHMSTLGNSRIWLTETVINKIADRNIKGLVTIVLSEIDVKEFEDCGEMEVVNLKDPFQSIKTSKVLADFKGTPKSAYD